jgi:hypothetical protein
MILRDVLLHCQRKNAKDESFEKYHRQGKEPVDMNPQEKLGRFRAVAYAVGIAVIIAVTLWRLVPHIH